MSYIFKDSRGLLWVGTRFGLNMYDGNRFTSFFHIPGDTNSLVHNKILSIAEDQHQNLWIGTQYGVSCFNLLTRKFINYSRLNKGPRYLDIENCYVYPARDGNIWIGHGQGVVRLDPANVKTRAFALPLSPLNDYRNRYAGLFMEDDRSDLWVPTSYGVYCLKKGDTAFKSYRFPVGSPRESSLNACTRLAIDRQGTIYCGTWNAGILFFDREAGQFRRVETKGFMDITVFDFYFEKEKAWIAAWGSLFSINTSSLKNETNISWQRVYPEVSHIMPGDDYLWLASPDGLISLRTSGTAIKNYSYKNISEWNTLSIVEAGDDKLYISNGMGVMSYDLNTGKAKWATQVKSPLQLVRRNARGSGYWLTAYQGIYRLDNNLNIQELVTHLDPNNETEHFRSVYEDDEGVLWLSSGRSGLRQYDTRTKNWYSYFDKKETDIRQIKGDHFGNVWLASTLLIRFDRRKKAFEDVVIRNPLFDNKEVNNILSIYPKGNRVWIGTEAGLYYYDHTKDTVINIALPANVSPRINGVVADNNGHVWMDSNGSLLMYDTRQRTFKRFGEADGFTGREMSPRFTVLNNGDVVAGYNGGFAVIDPSRITGNSMATSPQFTGINIDNTFIADAAVSPILKYNQSISFSFVSPEFNPDEKVQYAYQLQPVDKEWNLIGNNTTQRFTNLPAGKYTFVVKAANASGVWNESANSYSFTVQPPFWKTWWFIILLACAAAGLIYALYRYRVNYLLRMERMRTRIATDLHDDIGATLSSISMYSQAIKQQLKENNPQLETVLDKMGDNSRDMVTSISDIVWAINPDNDDGKKLLQRMESYAVDTCALKEIRVRFKADEKINVVNLSLEYRKNIYLIFKEALINAVKYSNARNISVELMLKNKLLSLSVKDDGNGFNESTTGKGNGLKNMRIRSAEIRGALTIDTAAGKGTSVSLQCSI